MGLDMYMYCNDRELTHAVQDEEWRARRGMIMYWRKANAIHRWFVEHAEYSNQTDDCRPIDLTINDLEQLRDLCKEVLENPSNAPNILPTEDGFFFGSTEYGDDYFYDIEYTYKALDKILRLINPAKEIKSREGQYAGMTWADDRIYRHNDWILKFTYEASW